MNDFTPAAVDNSAPPQPTRHPLISRGNLFRSTEPLLATAWRGRYLVVGFAARDIPRIPLNLALLKERQILGVYWGEALQRNPRQHAANVRQLLQWFVAGSVRPEITEQLGLEQATQALLRFSQREAKGKIVVRIVAESET